MENEEVFRVLKCADVPYDMYLYSTKVNKGYNESFKYYTLTVIDNTPVINDIVNPIETLKNLNVKPLNIMDDNEEFMRFLAYKNFAEYQIINKKSH